MDRHMGKQNSHTGDYGEMDICLLGQLAGTSEGRKQSKRQESNSGYIWCII